MRSLVSSVAIQLWDALDRVTLLMDLGEYSEDPFDLQSKYGWEIGSGAVTRSRQEAADYRRAMRALEEPWLPLRSLSLRLLMISDTSMVVLMRFSSLSE